MAADRVSASRLVVHKTMNGVSSSVRESECASRQIGLFFEQSAVAQWSITFLVQLLLTNGARQRAGRGACAGDSLIDGPIDPHDVLSVLSIKELQRCLAERTHSAALPSRTDSLVDEQVDRFRFIEENEKVMNGRRRTG
jgi:hypothetical protein